MDGVLAVSEGKADVVFGLACFAKQCNLEFVPVIKERFDLLVCRKGWVDGPFQALT